MEPPESIFRPSFLVRPGLPPNFAFSQSSLQDFEDCPRRFELRYLLRLAWPAVQSEPQQAQERDLRLGQRFHRQAQQRLLGVPLERLEASLDDPELLAWQRNFEQFIVQAGLDLRPGGRRARYYPEAALTAPLAGQRLVAQYDLIVVGEAGRLTIYDWKTHRHRPRRAWLERRLQTKVYPYLLAHAGQGFLSPAAAPRIEMIYWFASFPDQPERFDYPPARFEQDRVDLARRIEQIVRLAARPLSQAAYTLAQAGRFPQTEQAERCAYCLYRSLCDRGGRAADWLAAEDDPALDLGTPDGFNFEQIAEIAF